MNWQRIASENGTGTTPEQMAVVYAIRRARMRHPGAGPSYRELADDLGVNINDIVQKVARLRRDGLVTWDEGVSRSIRIVGEQ